MVPKSCSFHIFSHNGNTDRPSETNLPFAIICSQELFGQQSLSGRARVSMTNFLKRKWISFLALILCGFNYFISQRSDLESPTLCYRNSSKKAIVNSLTETCLFYFLFPFGATILEHLYGPLLLSWFFFIHSNKAIQHQLTSASPEVFLLRLMKLLCDATWSLAWPSQSGLGHRAGLVISSMSGQIFSAGVSV